eukprot:350371-Chlamydomonas_euryale.AAC.8
MPCLLDCPQMLPCVPAASSPFPPVLTPAVHIPRQQLATLSPCAHTSNPLCARAPCRPGCAPAYEGDTLPPNPALHNACPPSCRTLAWSCSCVCTSKIPPSSRISHIVHTPHFALSVVPAGLWPGCAPACTPAGGGAVIAAVIGHGRGCQRRRAHQPRGKGDGAPVV